MKPDDTSRAARAMHVNFPCAAIVALLFSMAAEVPTVAQTSSSFESQISAGQAALASGSFDRALTLGDAAIRINPERWDGYALAGLALLNLRQYEPAADALSKAIERAPNAQQSRLRDLRRQCLVAESVADGRAPAAPSIAPVAQQSAAPTIASSPQTGSAAPPSPVAGRAASLNLRGSYEPSLWVDPSSGLTWARPWYYPAPDRAWPWNLREAQSFCTKMYLGGYSDWRLPTAEELQHVFHESRRSWLWSSPTFDPGYGIDDALAHKQWRLAEFVIDGQRYPGRRLLLWTSTPADKAGEHVGLYFGRPYNVGDDLRMGVTLEGSALPTPFQGYALCVRSGPAG